MTPAEWDNQALPLICKLFPRQTREWIECKQRTGEASEEMQEFKRALTVWPWHIAEEAIRECWREKPAYLPPIRVIKGKARAIHDGVQPSGECKPETRADFLRRIWSDQKPQHAGMYKHWTDDQVYMAAAKWEFDATLRARGPAEYASMSAFARWQSEVEREAGRMEIYPSPHNWTEVEREHYCRVVGVVVPMPTQEHKK